MTTNEQRPWRATAKAVEGDALSPDSTAVGPPPQEPEAAGLPEAVRANDGYREKRADRHPEAAGLPITLAEALAELAAILPGLKAALDRQADPRPEPLVYRKSAAAPMCGMSVRAWERLLSAGKAPRPDAYAGKCPLWTRATLEAWIARGGSK